MTQIVSVTQQGKVGIVTINNPPVNAISQAVRQGLYDAFLQLKQNTEIGAIVLTAAGRTFVAGADIREFGLDHVPAPDYNDVQALIESFDIPVVGVLHGTVLGGGLELALSCHYRIALEGTRLGLPEVTLGIVPGAGGTQRLPRLVGVPAALDIIVTGKPVDAAKALELGLIDARFISDLAQNAIDFANKLIGSDVTDKVISKRTLEIDTAAKQVIQAWLHKIPAKDKGGNAAHACIDCIQSATKPFEQGLAYERSVFAACKDTVESQSLRHVFFAQRESGKIPNLPGDTKIIDVENVGIVGAGTMGIGIAISFASAGYAVTLVDFNADSLTRAEKTIKDTFMASVAKGRISQNKANAAISLVQTTTNDLKLSNVDLVIEAVFEDLEIKKKVFTRLGEITKPNALLASNTSTLDINVLAQCAGKPSYVLGMHFFSPANIMRLLEVIRGDDTAPEVLATAMNIAKRIGKVAVVSGVCFGFIGNRMLEGYIKEAEALLLEGASPEQIDKALEDFGFVMGPCRVMDLAGIDVGAKVVLEQKKANMLPDDPIYRVVGQKLFELGRLGQKSGMGYYQYDGRTPISDPEVIQIIADLAKQHGVKQRSDISAEEIMQRCVLPLISEGHKILDEGIAYRSGDIDVVWLYGYGFPAWRGGPMFYAKTIGDETIAALNNKYFN